MKKSKNNLVLLRKFSYNLLRIAMIREKRSDLMTEMMDEFCDDHALIEKYVNGQRGYFAHFYKNQMDSAR